MGLVQSAGDAAVEQLFGANMLQFYVGRTVPASVLMVQRQRQRAASARASAQHLLPREDAKKDDKLDRLPGG